MVSVIDKPEFWKLMVICSDEAERQGDMRKEIPREIEDIEKADPYSSWSKATNSGDLDYNPQGLSKKRKRE